MDDFVLSNLHESRNEWCSRLVSIFTPLIIEGIQSIFTEAYKVCEESNEITKYLMTFQNFLSRIPKWNALIIEGERKRIIERSGCNYLEDLITCVHIIQLKVLTCIRVGNRQKKIDITIPKLDSFIHKIYVHVARKLYLNVYLFETGKNITKLQMQKNLREFEIIVQECIMTTIRESIPTEEIIRAYMDESIEQEEEITIEPIAEPVLEAIHEGQSADGTIVPVTSSDDTDTKKDLPSIEEDMPVIVEKPKITNLNEEPVKTTLNVSFHPIEGAAGRGDPTTSAAANEPKRIERLEEIGSETAFQKSTMLNEKLEENIKIHQEDLNLGKDWGLDMGIIDLDSHASGLDATPVEMDPLDLDIEEI